MKIEEYEAAAEAILFAMGDSVEIKNILTSYENVLYCK